MHEHFINGIARPYRCMDAGEKLVIGGGIFVLKIDTDKVEEEKRFDGIFVLRTNNPLKAMLCYKQLWTVEQTFRTAKHLLASRPIFHKLDETIRGHVFCSFLACSRRRWRTASRRSIAQVLARDYCRSRFAD